MDFDYLAKVTALNIATANSLAAAPPAPASAKLGGAVSSDTKVEWSPVLGASGYRVYVRKADQPNWGDVVEVSGGAATSHVLTGVIVDDHFVGVSAVNASGKESIITFAGLPPRQ